MITLDEFRSRVTGEMAALGETPSVAEVEAAIARAVELGQPEGGSLEGLMFHLGRAKARESRRGG